MKEDVLEQVVEDYLQLNGYFTSHNVRFRPDKAHAGYVSREDSVSSDVDVVGFSPKRTGPDRVMVVSCKAYQSGFDATRKLAEMNGEAKGPKRPTWMHFRELWVPKWSEAFRRKIEEITGETSFSYRIAVTHLKGDRHSWAADPTIQANLPGIDIGFVTLAEMWSDVNARLTNTPASSEIGRLAQLLKAAGITPKADPHPPQGTTTS